MSAQTPQRYDCAGPKHPWEHCEGCYHMEPHPRGDYVHWDDYDDLRALNAELLAVAQRLAESVREGISVHEDPECSAYNECDKPGERCQWCETASAAIQDLNNLAAKAKGETP